MFSASKRHATQVRKRVSLSLQSPVAVSRYRGVEAIRDRANGWPVGVNRRSGSSTRLPAMVIVVWLLPGGPPALGSRSERVSPSSSVAG